MRYLYLRYYRFRGVEVENIFYFILVIITFRIKSHKIMELRLICLFNYIKSYRNLYKEIKKYVKHSKGNKNNLKKK